MEKYLKKYYHLFFLGVAVFLLYPIFQKGYIFLLDWDVQPNIAFSDIDWRVDSAAWMIYKIIAAVFSFGAAQRLFLFATVYFAGIAGFRLAKKTENVYGQYFSGLFLIFNPFLYGRLVEQPGIAAGSVLFFWFLVYFLEYLEKREMGKMIAAAICAAFSVGFFAHSIFFVSVTFFVLCIFEWIGNKDKKNIAKLLAIAGVIIIALNINWLAVVFLGGTDGTGAMQSFNLKDVETFQTKKIGGSSIYFTVLALQGYWGEHQNRYVAIRENPFWRIAFWMIFSLAIWGLIKTWKRNHLGKALAVLFSIAYILTIGISSLSTKPLAIFIYENVPFYIGLREPQKWVAILVFAYAFLGAWGIKYIMETEKMKKYRCEWGVFLAFLPVLFSFSAIRGIQSHFTPHQFPKEWAEAKNFLPSGKTEKILVFPWHLYMKLDFAGKNIVVPAKYFGKNIIQGNNTEFGKVYSHSADEQTLTIEKYTFRKDDPEDREINPENFSEDMKKIGIGAVVLLKAEDWKKYDWLNKSGNANKILENDKLVVYDL